MEKGTKRRGYRIKGVACDLLYRSQTPVWVRNCVRNAVSDFLNVKCVMKKRKAQKRGTGQEAIGKNLD